MIDVWGTPVMATVEQIIADVRSNENLVYMKKVRRTGQNLLVTCPFHGEGQEKHPSCGISLKDSYDAEGKKVIAGTYHCFTCGSKGSLPKLISWVVYGSRDEGMAGYKWLVSHYVAVELARRTPIQLEFAKERNPHFRYPAEIELESYRFYHPYMFERKMTEKIIDLFDIGYDANLNCITFPVRDYKGNLMFVQTRAVEKKQFYFPGGAPKSLHLFGLYQAYQNMQTSQQRHLYICESPIDALTIWTYGEMAVATMGAPSVEQVRLLNNSPIKRLITAFDKDDAGRRFSAFLEASCRKITNYLKIPEGCKDVNDMTSEQWQDKKILLRA